MLGQPVAVNEPVRAEVARYHTRQASEETQLSRVELRRMLTTGTPDDKGRANGDADRGATFRHPQTATRSKRRRLEYEEQGSTVCHSPRRACTPPFRTSPPTEAEMEAVLLQHLGPPTPAHPDPVLKRQQATIRELRELVRRQQTLLEKLLKLL